MKRQDLLTLNMSESEPLVEYSEDEEECDYEEAIEKTGYGKFHYLFLLVCGWANAADAVEILCISFLLPSAECDLQLTSVDKGWLSAVLFLGMLIGGYIWGSLGDHFGRKRVLMVAMYFNAASGVLSSFSQTKNMFIVMRFLSGLGVGGSIPIVWTYFSEFQPKDKRGGMLSFLAMFWMIGNITVAAIAWAVIPHQLGYDTDDPSQFEYNSWRIFVLICSIPALLVAISLAWLPESPKYLITKGKQRAAIEALSKIYQTNTGNHVSTYPVKRIIGESNLDQDLGRSLKEKLTLALTNAMQLFHRRLRRATVLMLYINFAIQFGYYGLWLWFPELFNKLDQYYATHNETKSVCEVVDLEVSEDEGDFCDSPPPGQDVFINSFIISLAALPGNIWTIVHMDKLGRKFFLVLSMILSGACAFLIYLVTTSFANLLVSCAFGLVSTMGFNALDCLGVELFPTHLRSTAMAITLIPARMGAILGNVAFGYLVETNCAIPILSVAVLLASGGLAGLFLPNTTRVALT